MSHAAQSPDNGSDSRSASQHTSTSQQTRKPWMIGIVAAFILAAATTIGVFAFQGNNGSQQRNSGGATSSQTTPATNDQSGNNGSDTSNKGQGSSAGTDTQNQTKPQIKETAPSEPGEGDASVDFSDGVPAQ